MVFQKIGPKINSNVTKLNSKLEKSEDLKTFAETKDMLKQAFNNQYSELRTREKVNIYFEKGVVFAGKTAKLPKFIAQTLFDIKSAYLFIKADIKEHNAFVKGYMDTIK
jgi:16S rRNA A1518/A1519 N6-dimethyltransferase RsmA/KsgA/DIM1 with predicted DNA glycosylase/AP lyase activity